MFQKIIQRLLQDVTDGVKHSVEAQAGRILGQMVRTLVLAGVGITLLAAGSVFLLVGAVTYFSRFMFSGLAWGLVGVMAALVGVVLLLLVRR